MSGTTQLVIIGALLVGTAFLFMNRCQYLGMCDDGPMAPIPEPAEAVPVEDLPAADVGDGSQDPRTTIINNQYYPVQPQPPVVIRDRRYVPVPVPPRFPSPPPAPKCVARIVRNGATYQLTSLKRLPDVMTMEFPPPYIKEGSCIYQRVRGPAPAPQVRRDKCCECRTTGPDSAVKCTSNNGKTWVTYAQFKYDIDKSLTECKKSCSKGGGITIPIPWPGIDIDIHRSCDEDYCRRYPSRCTNCTPRSTHLRDVSYLGVSL